MSQDINVQLIVDSPTEGWTPLIGYPINGGDPGSPTTSTLLLSGPNDPDAENGGPAQQGTLPFGAVSASPACFWTGVAIRTPVPGTTNAGPFQFQMLTWTGTQYSSYAAAVGQPGTYTGRSGVFAELTCYSIMPPMPNAGFLNNMPAFTMQQQLPGDANGDGTVDINDLTIVLANYGQSGA